MIPKFRFFHRDYGMFDDPDLLNLNNGSIKYDSDWYDAKDGILMQYTGIKDAKGVDIYEGDILKILEVTDYDTKEYLTDVKWEDCSFVVKSDECIDYYDTFLAAWTGDPNATYPLFELEIVGNIHENPELLKEDTAYE